MRLEAATPVRKIVLLIQVRNDESQNRDSGGGDNDGKIEIRY